MNRLDKFVVAVVFLATLLSAAIKWQADERKQSAGRRPVPIDEPRIPHIGPGTAPVRRPPVQAEPLAQAEPLIIVRTETRTRHVTGTAFSVDLRGVWVTARHVADSCAQIGILVGSTYLPAHVTYSHPAADLAILATSRGTPALPPADRSPEIGQDGFSLGFPHGQLGAAHSNLLGRSRMQLTGHLTGIAPILTWAEAKRFPDDLPSLGGLSGAPIVDAEGNVVGVHVASSQRRGRIHSVAPEIIDEARRETASSITHLREPVDGIRIHRDALPQLVSTATERSRIAKIYCRAPAPS